MEHFSTGFRFIKWNVRSVASQTLRSTFYRLKYSLEYFIFFCPPKFFQSIGLRLGPVLRLQCTSKRILNAVPCANVSRLEGRRHEFFSFVSLESGIDSSRFQDHSTHRTAQNTERSGI